MDIHGNKPSDAEQAVIDGITSFATRSVESDRSRGLMVIGPPRSGKSWYLHAFQTFAWPQSSMDDDPAAGSRSVAIVAVPGSPPTHLAQEIAKSLRETIGRVEPSDAILERTRNLLSRRNVDLLLVDEAHHLIGRRSRGSGEGEVETDDLLHVLTVLDVPFVLFGDETLPDELAQAEPQLSRRIVDTIRLDPTTSAGVASVA